ncbi:OTU domain-containing protein 3-like isoform X2 [Branchiostoma floridae]|uniref:OTU domain-containing protein 3 n=1 Tax=Branchiostoma floridae TaxID=7739 RepID=A0A9J7MDS8_BRAFL|nr:OTU domain-containing protein 3-like isoform X2 [Branchiostoma floridae]
MSRRNNKPTKGHPSKHEQERKRDERATKAAYRRERKAKSYLEDDENFAGFANQLAVMGLKIRDIPGDGNCLFRALNDQLEGHSNNHLQHRREVVEYIIQHRQDFEPFVEDDVPFDRHVSELRKHGTYAGNDAIVAFARLHGVNVVIHQLNKPLFHVKGSDRRDAPELHISYHNGDHYCSVRRIADNSDRPANVKIAPGAGEERGRHKQNDLQTNRHNYHTDYPIISDYGGDFTAEELSYLSEDRTDMEEFVMNSTGCQDLRLIRETLEDHHYDLESTVDFITQIMFLNSENAPDMPKKIARSPSSDYNINQRTANSHLWSEDGTANRVFGGTGTVRSTSSHSSSGGSDSSRGAGGGARAKVHTQQKQAQTKLRRGQARLEKKKRQEERHRQRVVGNKQQEEQNDDDAKTVLVKDMSLLSI